MSGQLDSLVGTRLPESVCARCAHTGGLLGWLEEALPPLPFAMCFSAAEDRPGGIERAASASRSPHLWVVNPDLLDAKDPGDLVQRRGIEAWARASAAPICGITWRALELTGPLTAITNERERRSSLAASGAWLATLHPRHAIEQSNALNMVADTLGYDVPAVQCAFPARHWELSQTIKPTQRGIDR